MSRDQISLTHNPKSLVENLLFADLYCFFGSCSGVGHVIETPDRFKGSRPGLDSSE